MRKLRSFMRNRINMENYFYSMLPDDEMSQLKYIPTVPEFLNWIEEKWGDKPALSNISTTYTYSEMCLRISRRRGFLNELGLEQGDKVAILEKSSIDAVEMFLAVTSAGYVAIMLPTQLPAQVVAGCCLKFGVKVLAVREELHSSVEGVIPENVKMISSASMAQEGIPVAEVSKDAPAAIFFTGGTTGAPKGAILPHRAIMRGAFNGVFAPGPQLGYHRQVGILPLSHVFGLIKGTLGALYTGSLWFSAEDSKATIGKLPVIKPTMLVLVPGLCEIIMGLAKMYGAGFLGGELKTIIAGAANVSPLLIKEFDKLGIQLLAGYGMTESGNLTSGNADVVEKPTSVGKIYPEQEVKIVDGEIWIKGDNVFLGYYGNPEETAKVLTEDGWLKTGDLGRFDEEGYLYITGRIKNLIILSNGENVSPESIEEPFYAYNEIKDCLAYEEDNAITIEILPRMEMFDSKEWGEVEAFFDNVVSEVNGTLPSTHHVSRVKVRKEDFKRSGAMKILRNQ